LLRFLNADAGIGHLEPHALKVVLRIPRGASAGIDIVPASSGTTRTGAVPASVNLMALLTRFITTGRGLGVLAQHRRGARQHGDQVTER
jgi:hypothetical protein